MFAFIQPLSGKISNHTINIFDKAADTCQFEGYINQSSNTKTSLI